MPYIHSVCCALPPHYYDQETLIQGLLKHWAKRYFNPRVLPPFTGMCWSGGVIWPYRLRHTSSSTACKHVTMPGWRCHWISPHRPLAVCWPRPGYRPMTFVCWPVRQTGLAVPSLEARLMNRLPFARDTKRMPFLGSGVSQGLPVSTGWRTICRDIRRKRRSFSVLNSAR